MSMRIGPLCDGCGMCRKACPRGAIRWQMPAPGVPPLYVRSLDCNDCLKCVVVCPRDAIEQDPEWAVCWGRGCPLSSSRFDGWTCSEGRRRCTECGNSLWRAPDEEGWVCLRCDMGAKVICPKVRKAAAVSGSSG